MKKLFGIVSVLVLSFSILAGCGSNKNNTGTPAATDMPATTPAATDMPATTPAAAASDADLTPAGADTDTDTDEVAPAIDLTAYPVMWILEFSLNATRYELNFSGGGGSKLQSDLASGIYEKGDILGTELWGFRLIDDTHVESFARYIFNDDIDTSIMITSQDELYNRYYSDHVTKISDREEEALNGIYTYEINGTEFIITDEETSKTLYTFQFSPDFTSLVDGRYEYTYRADF